MKQPLNQDTPGPRISPTAVGKAMGVSGQHRKGLSFQLNEEVAEIRASGRLHRRGASERERTLAASKQTNKQTIKIPLSKNVIYLIYQTDI